MKRHLLESTEAIILDHGHAGIPEIFQTLQSDISIVDVIVE